MMPSDSLSLVLKFSLTDTVFHPSLQKDEKQIYSRKHRRFSAQAPSSQERTLIHGNSMTSEPSKAGQWDWVTHLQFSSKKTQEQGPKKMMETKFVTRSCVFYQGNSLRQRYITLVLIKDKVPHKLSYVRSTLQPR